jgi:hypothetical protein
MILYFPESCIPIPDYLLFILIVFRLANLTDTQARWYYTKAKSILN